jgi:hypothetical protein
LHFVFLINVAGMKLSPWEKTPKPRAEQGFYFKVAPRFELGVEVLQTSALPLGYATASF